MNLKRESDTAVAVFGLTGDPFTVAHRAICKRAMDELPIDKLYVIPTIVNYHRKDKEHGKLLVGVTPDNPLPQCARRH